MLECLDFYVGRQVHSTQTERSVVGKVMWRY